MYVKNKVENEEAQLRQKFDKHCPNHPITIQKTAQKYGKDPKEHYSLEKEIETVEGAWNPGVTTTFPYPSLRARILGPG